MERPETLAATAGDQVVRLFFLDGESVIARILEADELFDGGFTFAPVPPVSGRLSAGAGGVFAEYIELKGWEPLAAPDDPAGAGS